MAHFRKAAEANFIALPSGKTKVSWDFSNPEHLVLVVRVAVPVGQRAKVEQAVFRQTWRAVSDLVGTNAELDIDKVSPHMPPVPVDTGSRA
jgi:hypothetical protein